MGIEVVHGSGQMSNTRRTKQRSLVRKSVGVKHEDDTCSMGTKNSAGSALTELNFNLSSFTFITLSRDVVSLAVKI